MATENAQHPDHYNQFPVEAIEIVREFCFNLGNVIKYVWRSKFKGNEVEDLQKALFYLDDEIKRKLKDASVEDREDYFNFLCDKAREAGDDLSDENTSFFVVETDPKKGSSHEVDFSET